MWEMLNGHKTKLGVWMYVVPLVLMYFLPEMDKEGLMVFMQDVLAPALVGVGVVHKVEKHMGKK